MSAKILSTHIALPEFSESLNSILPYAGKWAEKNGQRTKQKVLKIFKNAQIDTRYSILPINEVFSPSTFEERNTVFHEKAIALGKEALKGAIEKANIRAKDIDIIITTSCTGIMIPSVDAYLVNALNLRQDVIRLPVTEMGCAGGTSALIYANQMQKNNPNVTIAVIAIESPTSTFQLQDYSLTNIVSAAIFGDGAACAIIGPTKKIMPAIEDTNMYHFPDAIRMMGFDLKNTGLHIVLDPKVPESIKAHFPKIIFPFLQRNKLELQDVQHFIFHPGGKKIVQTVEKLLHAHNRDINITKEVLKKYGNMSSATILYVLDAYLQKEISANEKGLMLSFGPGFSAQTILLNWQ